jgi:hypothetical protein
MLMALWLAGPAAAANATAPACPGPQAPALEHFISADCPDCWAGTVPGSGTAGWRFDWILPRGADDALAAGALRDASARAERLGLRPWAGPGQTTQPWPAEPNLPQPSWRLQVSAGPAWAGYVGLQLTVLQGRGQPLPAGTSAWLALVELLPAGSEGTAQARALVRSVAGPLPLASLARGTPLSHLQAMRWPEGAQPARLQARAWLEAPGGRLLAVAADRCPVP